MNKIHRNHVFISYSHKDVRWLERLNEHLCPLARNGTIVPWDDTKLSPGSDWRKQIQDIIASAKVAVLLVSPSFLASDFIANNELPPLLDAAKNEGLIILWIAIRNSSYKETPIEAYQAVNNPSKPLSALGASQRDRELVRICEKIKQASEVKMIPPSSKRPANNLIGFAKSKVALTLDIEFEKFDEKQQRLFRYALAGFLEIPPDDVSITDIRRGSVIVTIELPPRLISDLLQPSEEKAKLLLPVLTQFHILKIQLVEAKKTSKDIAGKIKWFNNASGYGFVVAPDGEDVFIHFSVIETVTSTSSKSPDSSLIHPVFSNVPTKPKKKNTNTKNEYQ